MAFGLQLRPESWVMFLKNGIAEANEKSPRVETRVYAQSSRATKTSVSPHSFLLSPFSLPCHSLHHILESFFSLQPETLFGFCF